MYFPIRRRYDDDLGGLGDEDVYCLTFLKGLFDVDALKRIKAFSLETLVRV